MSGTRKFSIALVLVVGAAVAALAEGAGTPVGPAQTLSKVSSLLRTVKQQRRMIMEAPNVTDVNMCNVMSTEVKCGAKKQSSGCSGECLWSGDSCGISDSNATTVIAMQMVVGMLAVSTTAMQCGVATAQPACTTSACQWVTAPQAQCSISSSGIDTALTSVQDPLVKGMVSKMMKCSMHPTKETCTADPKCKYTEGNSTSSRKLLGSDDSGGEDESTCEPGDDQYFELMATECPAEFPALKESILNDPSVTQAEKDALNAVKPASSGVASSTQPGGTSGVAAMSSLATALLAVVALLVL